MPAKRTLIGFHLARITVGVIGHKLLGQRYVDAPFRVGHLLFPRNPARIL